MPRVHEEPGLYFCDHTEKALIQLTLPPTGEPHHCPLLQRVR